MYSKNTSCNCSLLFGLEFLRCTRSHNCIISFIMQLFQSDLCRCFIYGWRRIWVWGTTQNPKETKAFKEKWKEWMKKNIGNREVQHPRKCWSSACASDLCQHYGRCQGNQEHIHKAIKGLLLQRKTHTNATRKTVSYPHVSLFMQTDIFHSSWNPLLFLISLIRNGTLPSKAVQWLPQKVTAQPSCKNQEMFLVREDSLLRPYKVWKFF